MKKCSTIFHTEGHPFEYRIDVISPHNIHFFRISLGTYCREFLGTHDFASIKRSRESISKSMGGVDHDKMFMDLFYLRSPIEVFN